MRRLVSCLFSLESWGLKRGADKCDVATIGVDFKVKVIERRNRRWKLSIWVSLSLSSFVVDGGS